MLREGVYRTVGVIEMDTHPLAHRYDFACRGNRFGECGSSFQIGQSKAIKSIAEAKWGVFFGLFAEFFVHENRVGSEIIGYPIYLKSIFRPSKIREGLLWSIDQN